MNKKFVPYVVILVLAIVFATMIISYMDVFFYLGVFFIICAPMVLLAKNLKKGEAIHIGH